MKYNRLILSLILIIPLSLSVSSDEIANILKLIKGGDLFETNKILASPEMKGRLSGSEGYNRAAKWAAGKFREWGLTPVYGDSFLQPFEVGYNEMRETAFSLFLPPENKNEAPQALEMEIYKDFCPTLYSGFGKVVAEVVFVGFGLTAPELGWNDYKDLEVSGKVVATLHGTPQIEGKDFSAYSHRQPKLDNAARHGAAGMILINRAVVSGSGKYMESLPMVMVGDKVADLLFKQKGCSIKDVKKRLRKGDRISFATGVKVLINSRGKHHDKSETYNVVGMVIGSDPALKEECLIYGGHLDHLGPWPVLHPGASDNASGSAVVMGLAYAFSRLKTPPKRSIVFALFGAEELGLLGSRHMASNLPKFPSRPIMMSNHDMNGVGKSIYIAGGKAFPEYYEQIVKANEAFSISSDLTPGTITAEGGNSDYAPFLEIGIPAYSTWVRGGQGYGVHTAEDTIYLITPKVMEDIVKLNFTAGCWFADK